MNMIKIKAVQLVTQLQDRQILITIGTYRPHGNARLRKNGGPRVHGSERALYRADRQICDPLRGDLLRENGGGYRARGCNLRREDLERIYASQLYEHAQKVSLPHRHSNLVRNASASRYHLHETPLYEFFREFQIQKRGERHARDNERARHHVDHRIHDQAIHVRDGQFHLHVRNDANNLAGHG